jgi:hypothetical protein
MALTYATHAAHRAERPLHPARASEDALQSNFLVSAANRSEDQEFWLFSLLT